MAFAKFEGNRLRIDGEIAGNAILDNLTASIVSSFRFIRIPMLCSLRPL